MLKIIPNFHPAVVHFPIALTMVAFAAACASQLFKKRVFASQLATVSHYLLWLAAISAVVAVAFGWLAYNSVNHDDAGHIAMGVHKLWAFSTTTVLVLLTLFDFKQYQSNTVMPIYMVCLLGLSSALVGGTGWLGGEVVFRHGIGVISLPAQDGAKEMSYENGPSAAHEHDLLEHGLHEHGLVEHGLAEHGLVEHGLAEHDLVKHGLAEHGSPENATPQTKPDHDAKAVPDVQKSAMQGHDMSTMPMDEATQALDHKATNSTENQAHEISDKRLSAVQDESKPHKHQHKK